MHLRCLTRMVPISRSLAAPCHPKRSFRGRGHLFFGHQAQCPGAAAGRFRAKTRRRSRGPDWPSHVALGVHYEGSGATFWWLPWNGGSNGLQNIASTEDVTVKGWRPPSPDGGPVRTETGTISAPMVRINRSTMFRSWVMLLRRICFSRTQGVRGMLPFAIGNSSILWVAGRAACNPRCCRIRVRKRPLRIPA